MNDNVLEEAARLVYESWGEVPGWVPWVPNGNSLKQDEARGVAARILRLAEQSKQPPKPYPMHPFTIGDAPIRYFSKSIGNEFVCVHCGNVRAMHINDVCPSTTMLCSGE